METYNLKSGNTLEVIQDGDCSHPRTDFDNLGKMVCFHSRYDLGDKTTLTSGDFNSWAELEQHLIKKEKAVVILPLYLYDHSGITIATKPFSCPWDSGQVGYIYVTREAAMIEYSTKRITAAIKEKILAVLQAEVKTYDQYLTGDVYGYKVKDTDDEELDSCWGFYGSDPAENGMLEQCGEELA